MKVLKITEEEAMVLINLIDTAVKAAGLQAAHAGYTLAAKIKNAPVDTEKLPE